MYIYIYVCSRVEGSPLPSPIWERSHVPPGNVLDALCLMLCVVCFCQFVDGVGIQNVSKRLVRGTGKVPTKPITFQNSSNHIQQMFRKGSSVPEMSQ